SSPYLGSSSPDLGSSSPDLKSSSPNLDENRDADGCLIANQLSLPIIDDLSRLSPHLRKELEEFAAEPRTKRKVDRETLRQAILHLCLRHFVTLRALATLVQRKPETLRDEYLTKLVRERKMSLAFPTVPTHSMRAYRTVPGALK
ncbi:MAG TPA: AAA family ATPase, partial [Candidatus Ozemobacteraceae bacterium]|nr:AAA family ATPase [Candidatus Ozemobacteraceae bacterium]